jgi:predicted transcriptional regulator
MRPRALDRGREMMICSKCIDRCNPLCYTGNVHGHLLKPSSAERSMSYAFPAEIKQLIDQNLATGLYTSEEHVLQAALHVLSDYNATVADIRQGMVDYEQGRGVPLAEAMADIRGQLGSLP